MKTWLALSRWSGVVLALSFVGSIVWSGCGGGDDRYYCDNAGCYSCDGYGCSTVTPPSTATCTGNKSCQTGEVCTTTGCLKTCGGDSDCAKGTVCKSGYCVAPGTTPGTTQECTTKADCGGTGTLCVAGKCQTCGGTNGPCPCTASTDCANGNVCSNGTCTAPVNTCKYSSECSDGKVCADGACVKTCTTATECGAGNTCTKGVCEPDPTQAQCTGDAQCSGATPKCAGGSCVASCTGTDPAECGDGKYCNQGACVIDTRPKPICSDTDKSACAANQQCIGGFCRYPCTTDANCKVIDARIGYCGTDGVCRTLAEAHPQCTGTTGCTAPQTCIDSVCK